MQLGIPTFFNITPMATYITAAKANKICGFARIVPFPLYRIKLFH
jgi:hypothetical protein